MLALPEQLPLPLEMWLAEDCPATTGRHLEGHELVVETMKAEVRNVGTDREAFSTKISPGPQGHVSLALRSYCCCGPHRLWCDV